jgi:hypothetical protein
LQRSTIFSASMTTVLVGILVSTIPAFAADGSRPPDPCDKDLSVSDVEGILTGKAKVTHYSMSESKPGEGCELGVIGNGVAFIDLSIRQGNKEAFQTLLFFVPPPHKPIPGIGDEAYGAPTTDSNVPDAKETDLYARKGNLQCIVQLHRTNGDGAKLVIPATDDAIAAKLGGLCVKLFAAHAKD